MNILKNYKVTSKRYEGVPMIEVRNQEEVFLEMPICMLPYEKEETELYLLGVNPMTKFAYVGNKRTLKEVLKTNRMFFLSNIDEKGLPGEIREVPMGEHIFEYLFPIGTDVKDLVVYNGEVMLFEKQEQHVEKQDTKEVGE